MSEPEWVNNATASNSAPPGTARDLSVALLHKRKCYSSRRTPSEIISGSLDARDWPGRFAAGRVGRYSLLVRATISGSQRPSCVLVLAALERFLTRLGLLD